MSINLVCVALMPPDNGVDFDMHLERTLHNLDSLRSEMIYDVFMLYCSSNVPQIGEENKKVSPRRIYDDLKKSGFKVSVCVVHINVYKYLTSG